MLLVPSVILAAGPPICTFDGNGRVTNVDGGGSNDFCRLSATEFKINFKYAGICTSAPTEVNYRSVCTAIYDNTSGQDVEVTTSSSLPVKPTDFNNWSTTLEQFRGRTPNESPGS